MKWLIILLVSVPLFSAEKKPKMHWETIEIEESSTRIIYGTRTDISDGLPGQVTKRKLVTIPPVGDAVFHEHPRKAFEALWILYERKCNKETVNFWKTNIDTTNNDVPLLIKRAGLEREWEETGGKK